MYRSTLGLRVIKKKRRSRCGYGKDEETRLTGSHSPICASAFSARPRRAEWGREREFFIDNLLVRINLIIVMIRWTGLAPWEFESDLCASAFAVRPVHLIITMIKWTRTSRLSPVRERVRCAAASAPVGVLWKGSRVE